MLLGGLHVALKHPAALVWTYVFNLGVALLFSLRLHAQLASVLDHSLAAARLTSAFDLGTLLGVYERLSYRAPSSGSTGYAGLPIYLLIYFVLVPGTLFSYQMDVPAKLSTLLSTGLSFFWRFVRITLITALVSGILLAPLGALYGAWRKHVDEHVTGVAVYWHELPVLLLIALVAALLRLYFDLVEVYTVELGKQVRPNGKNDRRVRRVLLPALKTLRRNFWRACAGFIGIGLLGVLGLFLTGRIAVHMLAQPRVWPIFLLAQLGLFWNLLTRFWQRGAETVLACDNPLPVPVPPQTSPLIPAGPPTIAPTIDSAIPAHLPQDAQSDPEPPAPSLDTPDPGVFHHEVPPHRSEDT